MPEPNYQELTKDLLVWGMSQTEIGAAIGVSQAAVSHLQHGKTDDPKASVAFKLVRLHKRELFKMRKRINAA